MSDNIQFATAGTPAQVLAAIEAKIASQSTMARLGAVGVTGVVIPNGVLSAHWGQWGAIDAPDAIPAGHLMPSGQSWFFMRGW